MIGSFQHQCWVITERIAIYYGHVLSLGTETPENLRLMRQEIDGLLADEPEVGRKYAEQLREYVKTNYSYPRLLDKIPDDLK
jgi:hypothetical protein